MPVNSIDRWIERYAARIRLGEFMRRAAECGAAFLLAFGCLVLLVKLCLPGAWPHVLWMALGLIPVQIAAWCLARTGRQARWQSVAQLDAALDTGGLLMTLSERPDENWSRQLPQLEQAWRDAIPRVRPRRFVSLLALPAAFAVGACLVPVREASTAAPLRNTVGQEAARDLEELLQEIEKDPILEEEEEQQLKDEIARLAEESLDAPLTHEKWETIDALRERMKVRLESASMSLAQAQAAASILASAADSEAPELSLERTEQLEKDLVDTLQKMMKKGALSGASPELEESLQRLMKKGRAGLPKEPGERQELLDELREFLEKEDDRLCELRKKCSSCKSGQCLGSDDPDSECNGGSSRQGGGRPGKGGINRGRGDADLTWGDESDGAGSKFKEVVLPRGFLDQPKDEVVGIRKSAPEVEAAGTAPHAAGRELDPAAGQATWNRRLNPKHRNAVRRYFDEGKKSGRGNGESG